ncbi:hypothetical protein P7H10_21060, partial [Paenibacillus larvae]
ANKPTATEAPSEDKKDKKNIWTYYENAKWNDDFKGLKTEIEKVVVSDKAPQKGDSSKTDASSIGVRFKLKNTTDGKFTTYPDQARLVTSTGEQIENPEMILSDHIGGEIDKGVEKEGNVFWYLKKSKASDIEWIKLEWDARVGTDVGSKENKKYEVELKLK